jgi:hypothetical protein
MNESESESPQSGQSPNPGPRRFLLTILGGSSLAFLSYVAFFSFPNSGVAEGVAAVTYASLFLTGVVLFLGGCVQAIGFLRRKLKGMP